MLTVSTTTFGLDLSRLSRLGSGTMGFCWSSISSDSPRFTIILTNTLRRLKTILELDSRVMKLADRPTFYTYLDTQTLFERRTNEMDDLVYEINNANKRSQTVALLFSIIQYTALALYFILRLALIVLAFKRFRSASRRYLITWVAFVPTMQ